MVLMIPKIFHFVWIGPEPLPRQDMDWLDSWARLHNDWQCLVWSDRSDLEVPDGFEVRPLPVLLNQRFYGGIEQWVPGPAAVASRSDIARYEIVAQYGGIYVDTDVECFARIDDLIQPVSLFVADEWGPNPGNYLFGARPGHPAMWAVVRELGPHLLGLKGVANAVSATGPLYFNSRLESHPDLVIFPHMLFNPLCPHHDWRQVTEWPACSRANHHFDGKWYYQEKHEPPPEFKAAAEER